MFCADMPAFLRENLSERMKMAKNLFFFIYKTRKMCYNLHYLKTGEIIFIMEGDSYPPPDHIAAYIAILIVSVILSAFFSATETAYTSLNKARLKLRAENGKRSSVRALKLTENYDKLLFTILIGNNIVNIVMATVSALLFASLIENAGIAATVSTAVSTVIVLIFGEVTPKTVAKEAPEAVASAFSGFISFLIVLLFPLNMIFTGWKALLSKIFRFGGQDKITEEELLSYVEEASEDGTLDKEETELISSAIEFNDAEVGDILVPRVKIIAVEQNASMEKIKNVFLEHEFSRIPVYKGSIDTIIGMIHEKDFYSALMNDAKNIKGIITSMGFATEHMKISALLRQMQRQKVHMAAVIDEYGGTLGIVTLEDILEELVGEIWDEHDEVVNYFTKLDDNSYLVDGNAELSDFCKLFSLEEDESNDSNTVGGWVTEKVGDIPHIGYTFDCKNLSIEVTKRTLKRVLEIKVTVKREEETEQQE